VRAASILPNCVSPRASRRAAVSGDVHCANVVHSSSSHLITCCAGLLCSWINRFPWTTVAQVAQLRKVLERARAICAPNVVASVLRHERIDAICLLTVRIEGCACACVLCVQESDTFDHSIVQEGAHEIDQLIHLCLDHQAATYSGPAIRATCLWFTRLHGMPVDTSTYREKLVYYTGWVPTPPLIHQPVHSPGLGDKALLDSIVAAVDRLNSLLRIPCFARNPRILADEVQFLKIAGDRRHTISLLAQVRHGSD